MKPFHALCAQAWGRFSFPALTARLLTLAPSLLHAQTAGSLDPAFQPNVTGSSLYSMAVQPDGKILLAGTFSSIDSQTRSGIARLNADSTLEGTNTFNPGNVTPVYCAAIQPDGKILLGGQFTSIGGQIRNLVARLNPDGTVESTASFNPGTGVLGSIIYSVAVQADGKILLGGQFTSINDQPRNGIARLLPGGGVESTGTFNAGTGVSGSRSFVVAALQPDGKILLAGRFVSVDGQVRNNIARLNSNGTVESAETFDLGGGVDSGDADSEVYAVAVQHDRKILLVGDFTTVNGQPRNNIARLLSDGTLESTATFNPGVGPDGFIYSCALQADGRILIGGQFTTVNGQPRNKIARLNADGSVESTATFNPGSGAVGNAGPGSVVGIALQPDGKILLGGVFASVDGQERNNIARLLNYPATQSLTVSSSARLLWMRGGSAPEVSQVTFEQSTNGGVNWQLLGTGTPITGGWELRGLALPGTGQVRARGRTTGGYRNGSSGMVETVAALTPAPGMAVEEPLGTILVGGTAILDFGPVVAGSSRTKTVTIRSTGTGDLSGLAVTKTADGTPGDFAIGTLGATTVPRDTSTTFDITFSPAAAGVRTATIGIASNDPDESPFVIHLTGSQATPLEAWRQSHFGSPYDSGTGADLNDPDSDGLVNLLEYATASDPLAESPPVGELVKNGNALEFTYTRRKAALAEMTFVREFSDTLTGTWSTVAGVTTILSDDGVLQVVKTAMPAGTAGKRFVRLRVTRL